MRSSILDQNISSKYLCEKKMPKISRTLLVHVHVFLHFFSLTYLSCQKNSTEKMVVFFFANSSSIITLVSTSVIFDGYPLVCKVFMI